jgi:hypothetical protein
LSGTQTFNEKRIIMKKTLLVILFLFIALTGSAQSVGIIGSATPTGWDSDTDMLTTDNVTYTLHMTFVTGEAKFRQDDAWTINWGATAFPTGTGTQNGPNIPVPAGTYDVTFNRTTGAYSFVGSSTFPSIGILGTAVGDDFNGPDVDLTTTDGVIYTLSGFTFLAGEAKFRQDDAWTNSWGATSFPSGTATLGGPNIPVPAGTFTVTFNRTTGAYNFGFVSIGIIGTAVNGWDADVDMTTIDGQLYTLANYTLLDGVIKFRQDDAWTNNWGGDTFPSGTAVAAGGDIPVTAGTYDISFDRNTLAYSFTSLGVGDFTEHNFSVYPNPSRGQWNFSSTEEPIESIAIFDITGKLVSVSQPKAVTTSVDAGSLNSGLYFAKITSANAVRTIKLIKE